MRRIIIGVVCSLACFGSYVAGVNNGYALGSDAMFCVTTALTYPDDETKIHEVCKSSNEWNHTLTYKIRRLWLKATGDEIPDYMIHIKK